MKTKEPSIAIDLRWLGDTGIGRYTRELIERAPVKIIGLDCGVGLFHPLSPLKLSSAIQKSKCSAFFATGTSMPIYCAAPLILTVHDMIPIDCPTERQLAKVIYYKTLVNYWLRRSILTFSDSNFSAQRVKDLLWPLAKIQVIPLAASSVFQENATHSSPNPYLLYVGNCKPHKNVGALLQILAQLSADFPLITLKMTGSGDPDFLQLAEKARLTLRVEFIGKKTDQELAEYYSGATALILPSFYEGFGLPVLEAMASGCPVVSSNRTSLPEVGGGAAMYFDPENISQAVSHIKHILLDDSYRTKCKQEGMAHAQNFSWERAAGETWRHVLASLDLGDRVNG